MTQSSSDSGRGSTGGGDGDNTNAGASEYVPRPKRIACVLCRKRKLRCDGTRPSCGTCSRLGHECNYDEVRKKSGPKRGYVKQLEARLAQVETLLKTQDGVESPEDVQDFATAPDSAQPYNAHTQTPNPLNDPAMESTDASMLDPQFGLFEDPLLGMNNDFSWEMISLGVEEPLPEPDIMNELHDIYFRKIHPLVPMLHRARFYAALNLSPHMKPPICLRYAMWTLAASVTPKYESVVQIFYQRARKYVEGDEMKGLGEQIVTLTHAQCWGLIAMFEFKSMYFPRAWMSVGRGARLTLMMSLHRLDGEGLDVKQCLPPARDWIELEERRRTFWVCFANDRYASAGTGWPMVIDEKDIQTALPTDDRAYQAGQEKKMPALNDVINGKGVESISSYAGVCLMAYMFGRNLHHLHRSDPLPEDNTINSPFWKRHRTLDNILLTTSLSLPASLRLPQGLSDPNTIYTNMNLHTATIFLHQAAIFKADKDKSTMSLGSESKRRCIVAAESITSIMKLITTVDLSLLHPFTSFSIYIAGRVFVHYLKSMPDDSQAMSSLQFLLAALKALKDISPITQSFMVQLDLDLETSGITVFRQDTQVDQMNPMLAQMHMNDAVRCSPLFEIREGQAQRSKEPTKPWTPAPGVGVFPMGAVTDARPPLAQHTSASSDIRTFTSTSSTDVRMGAQDPSASVSFDLSSEQSRSTSNHPTPSTFSHRGSSNTTSSSPAIAGNHAMSQSSKEGEMPLFNSSTSFDYGPSAFDALKTPQMSFGVSVSQNWSTDTGMSTGFTPKDTTGTDWTADLDNPQFTQQMDSTNWESWGGGNGQ